MKLKIYLTTGWRGLWDDVNSIFTQSELYNIVVGPLLTTDCTCYLLQLIPLSATCGRTPLSLRAVL